jgi:hypothetical protein
MNKPMRTSVALTLIGLNAAWVITMFANYASHVENIASGTYVFGVPTAPGEIRASTFLFLAAIAVFAVVSSVAHRIADQQQVLAGEGSRAAFAAWQAKNGFEQSGILSTRQRNKLTSDYASDKAEFGSATITIPIPGVDL